LRTKRDPLHVALEHARKKFRVGDKVRVRSSGDVGIVAVRPTGDVCTVASTLGAIPPHLYGVEFETGVKAVHPLLLVLVEPADQEHSCLFGSGDAD
jgi:hypothetical protein